MSVVLLSAIMVRAAQKAPSNTFTYHDQQCESILWKRAFAARHMTSVRVAKVKASGRQQYGQSRCIVNKEIKRGSRLSAVAFNRQGNYLAVASSAGHNGGVVYLLKPTDAGWDVFDEFSIQRPVNIDKIIFCPDDKSIIMHNSHSQAAIDCLVRDGETKRLQKLSKDITQYGIISNCTYSPDVSCLTVGQCENIRIFDSRAHTLIKTLKHQNSITKVAYSHNGQRLVAMDNVGRITMWDVSGERSEQLWSAAQGIFYGPLLFNADDSEIVVCQMPPSQVHVFDAVDGVLKKQIPGKLRQPYPGYRYSDHDATQLAVVQGVALSVRDCATDKVVMLKDFGARICDCVYINEDEVIVCLEHKLFLCNIKQEAHVCIFRHEDGGRLQKLIVNPADPHQLVAYSDQKAFLINIPDGFALLDERRALSMRTKQQAKKAQSAD